MRYTKIKMEFKGYEDRFYRVVAIKGNPDLFKLCVYLLTAVGSTFEHCFLINLSDTSFVMAHFMEEPMHGYKHLMNYNLDDLVEQFELEYDTGDGWDFNCEVLDETIEINSTKDIILLEGKGQGIWEDNIYSLWQYLDGKIDKDFNEEDPEKGIYKPWNFDIKKYSDFDLPLNIEKINRTLNVEAKRIYLDLKEQELEYIKSENVNTNDYYNYKEKLYWDKLERNSRKLLKREKAKKN